MLEDAQLRMEFNRLGEESLRAIIVPHTSRLKWQLDLQKNTWSHLIKNRAMC